MYGFSEFTSSLNELEEGVAPTDCRFRPDQRFMENQDFDKANEEKVTIMDLINVIIPSTEILTVHACLYLYIKLESCLMQ